MSTYLAVELRQQLLEADDQRCAYCPTTQANSGHPMIVDHVVPSSKGGSTEFDNLCFACHRCNEFKRSHSGCTAELGECGVASTKPVRVVGF